MFASLLAALVLGACATQPEIRGAELDAMMERHIAFIAENSDLEPLPPPRVEFHEDFDEFVAMKMAENRGIYDVDLEDIVGGYDLEAGVIHLREQWKPYVREEANLVHELVHYLQHVGGKPICARDWERQAYDIQLLWLRTYHPNEPVDVTAWEKGIPASCN